MSVDVGSLFSVPEVALVRRESAPSIKLGGSGVSERLMTPRGQSRLQLVHSVIEPAGTGGSELYTINCELEVTYCLKGAVDLLFNDRRQRLEAGDALTFAGGEPAHLGQRERQPQGRVDLGPGPRTVEWQRLIAQTQRESRCAGGVVAVEAAV